MWWRALEETSEGGGDPRINRKTLREMLRHTGRRRTESEPTQLTPLRNNLFPGNRQRQVFAELAPPARMQAHIDKPEIGFTDGYPASQTIQAVKLYGRALAGKARVSSESQNATCQGQQASHAHPGHFLFPTGISTAGCDIVEAERSVLCIHLHEMGDLPIGVRSSATNEAGCWDRRSAAVHGGGAGLLMLPQQPSDPT